MSGIATRQHFRGPFNRVVSAGPLRFIVIGGSILLVAAVVIGVGLLGSEPPLQSSAARPVNLNPLPGGTNSTPLQDRVALAEDQRQAERAAQDGRSFTPPIAASQPLQSPDLAQPALPPVPAAPRTPAPPRVIPEAAPQILRFTPVQQAEPPQTPTRPASLPQAAQGPVPAADDPAFRNAVQGLLAGWGGRPPQTTVILPPTPVQAAGRPAPGGLSDLPTAPRPGSEQTPPPEAPAAPAAPGARGPQGRVLIPAGRGVYAHTVLATNSETGGPVVLQADTGPIAGARMIGTFTRAGMTNRLVVRVTSVNFGGQSISVDGLVIAPETMDTSVATSVDHRLAERFLLPAAAAFVEGLGQAIARSNTTAVISPFGGASFASRLNTEEQLGVAAGAAGARIGQALEQATPRRATVHLAKDAQVGVLFLSNVTAPN